MRPYYLTIRGPVVGMLHLPRLEQSHSCTDGDSAEFGRVPQCGAEADDWMVVGEYKDPLEFCPLCLKYSLTTWWLQ